MRKNYIIVILCFWIAFGDNTTKHYTIIPMNVAASGILAFTAIAQVS